MSYSVIINDIAPRWGTVLRAGDYHTTLHYTASHYTTLHHTTLYFTTLHYITLHYTASHYTTLQWPQKMLRADFQLRVWLSLL